MRLEDGLDLHTILIRLGPDDSNALLEGRVFVGRKRITHSAHAVRPGDVVTLFPRRTLPVEPAYVVAQKDGMVALYKPAAMPTVADHHGRADSLLEFAAHTLHVATHQLHPTSRLDVGVSGVVLLARSPKAREHLQKARDCGAYSRMYLAIACGTPVPSSGLWDAPLGRGPNPRLRYVEGRDAKLAVSHYACLGSSPQHASLLRLEPQTGRTHQLRVHAAHACVPLYGDKPYGGPCRVVSQSGSVLAIHRIALHALAVQVPDAQGNPWRVCAPPSDELRALWLALDGPPEVWDTPVERMKES